MKIIFMGTPEFAVPSLEALSQYHQVLAVVTAPDKPAGRGHQKQISAVKKYAVDKNLPILQPKNLKSPKFYSQLLKLDAELFVVVAFRMLPEVIWSMPKFGTLNLHASLLPKYRGAAPIQRAIMNGEKITGLTVFKLKHEIDTGDILGKVELEIGEHETGGELHDRLMVLGGNLLLDCLASIYQGKLIYLPQENSKSSAAPKLYREDCRIPWNNELNTVYNHIRALDPYPGAWFEWQQLTIKIFKCSKIEENSLEVPGSLLIRNNKILISCNNGYINVLEIQPEGKRKMTAIEFINGYKSRLL